MNEFIAAAQSNDLLAARDAFEAEMRRRTADAIEQVRRDIGAQVSEFEQEQE